MNNSTPMAEDRITYIRAGYRYPEIKHGDVFGRWEVVGAGQTHKKRPMVLCQCGCQAKTLQEVSVHNLRTKQSRGCTKCYNIKHGLSKCSEYKSWACMLKRCNDPKWAGYSSYGGRGISVCDRWRFGENGRHGFECFIEDVGAKPTPQHSIERVDNNQGYQPDNCRWASKKEQSRNTRSNRLVKAFGVEMPLAEWCDSFSKPYEMVRHRISYLGWGAEKALTTPPTHP